VTGITNLPPGLDWYLPQTVFPLPDSTDGCLSICGVPLQAGTYMVHVVLSAQVFVFTQTASFRFPIVIEPAQSFSEGFSMTNATGCGAVQVTFENLVPSGAQTGFSYFWDFGNGNVSILENPAPQRYDSTGQYTVNYRAVVDTFGFTLHRIRLEEVGCSDLFNGPDLKVRIKGPDSTEVFLSPVVNNAVLPLELNIGIPLGSGNYLLEVVDEDAGLFGTVEAACGSLTFNRTLSGELTAGSLRVGLDILHRIDTIRSVDTVRVFPIPDAPQIMGFPDGGLCEGELLELSTGYSENLQWYKDSLPLIPGDNPVLEVGENGMYSVSYTTAEGCRVFSDEVQVFFNPLPEIPVFFNNRNLLLVFDTSALPIGAHFQWVRDGEIISGENGLSYCIPISGLYSLVVTDTSSGCFNTYTQPVVFDVSAPPCATDIMELLESPGDIRIYPNPAQEEISVEWTFTENQSSDIFIYDALGRLFFQVKGAPAEFTSGGYKIPILEFPAGYYLIQIRSGMKTVSSRFLKQ
jgi:hypothetical protein